jgi:multiple sugar transport system substrate-binding protein
LNGRIALGAVMGLAALAVAGTLGSAAATTQRKATNLKVLAQAGGPGDALVKLAAAYQKQHPDVAIKVTLLPYDSVRERAVADFASGKASYDVVAFDYLWMKEYARAKFITPLNDYVSKGGSRLAMKDFFKSYLDYGTLGGKLYGLPWLGAVYMLYYRTDLLKQAGVKVPTTWDQYAAAATKLKSGGVYGTTLIGKRDDPLVDEFWSIAWSYGAKINSGSAATMNSPAALKALTMWAKAHKAAPPDSLAADWPVAASTFAQGKAAMMLNFSDTSETILGKDSKVADKVGFAPLPAGPTGKRTPNLGGWGIGINSKSQSQQQAFDFIAWATGAAGQKAGLAFGGSATRASVLNDPSLQKKYPYFKATLANFKASVPFPQATNWVDWEAAMAPPMSEALGGQRSLASGLAEAQKRLAPLVKKEFG